MTLYHFSQNHASVENYPKWKGPTTIWDIPFFTEPWLWEEVNMGIFHCYVTLVDQRVITPTNGRTIGQLELQPNLYLVRAIPWTARLTVAAVWMPPQRSLCMRRSLPKRRFCVSMKWGVWRKRWEKYRHMFFFQGNLYIGCSMSL